MKDFLVALVMMFVLGVLSVAFMAAALGAMLRYTKDRNKKHNKVLTVLFPLLSVVMGTYAVFVLFGTGAAVVCGVILLILSLFIWAAYLVIGKSRKTHKTVFTKYR